jgi:hypothetical protein
VTLPEESPPFGVVCLSELPVLDTFDSTLAQDQSREIDQWLATDEDFPPKFDKGGERILGCSGFANTSLSVKRDLTQSSHYYFPFVFEPTEVMPRHRTRLLPSQPENTFQASCQLS